MERLIHTSAEFPTSSGSKPYEVELENGETASFTIGGHQDSPAINVVLRHGGEVVDRFYGGPAETHAPVQAQFTDEKLKEIVRARHGGSVGSGTGTNP